MTVSLEAVVVVEAAGAEAVVVIVVDHTHLTHHTHHTQAPARTHMLELGLDIIAIEATILMLTTVTLKLKIAIQKILNV